MHFSICREYGVSETWLRTGEGEMLLSVDEETRLITWIRSVFTDENAVIQKKIALLLTEISPDQWKQIEKMVFRLADVVQ